MFIVPTIPPTLRSPLTIPRFTLPETTTICIFLHWPRRDIFHILISCHHRKAYLNRILNAFDLLTDLLHIICDRLDSIIHCVRQLINIAVRIFFFYLIGNIIHKIFCRFIESEIVPRMLDRLPLIFCHSFETASACSLFKI